MAFKLHAQVALTGVDKEPIYMQLALLLVVEALDWIPIEIDLGLGWVYRDECSCRLRYQLIECSVETFLLLASQLWVWFVCWKLRLETSKSVSCGSVIASGNLTNDNLTDDRVSLLNGKGGAFCREQAGLVGFDGL